MDETDDRNSSSIVSIIMIIINNHHTNNLIIINNYYHHHFHLHRMDTIFGRLFDRKMSKYFDMISQLMVSKMFVVYIPIWRER